MGAGNVSKFTPGGGRFLFLAALLAACAVGQPAFAAAPQAPPCKLCFYGPDNIAFDASGNLYLVDADHQTQSRVLKLSPQGEKLAEWHVFPLMPGRDNAPNGITLDHDGNILVTDGFGFLKLSPAGKVLAAVHTDPATYDDQRHIAVDRLGDIYVTEALEDIVQEFSPDGKLLAQWHHTHGPGLDQLNHPEQISVAPDGKLVVQDWGNHRMVLMSPAGQALAAFDATQGVPLKLASIADACVDPEGHIYVADYQLYRVQEFDTQGRLLATIGNTPGNTLFEVAPNSLAMDRDGNLYATDGLSLIKFSRDGKLLARWR